MCRSMSGHEIDACSDHDLDNKISNVRVFYRTRWNSMTFYL